MRLGMMTETFKRFLSQEESLKLMKDLGFDVADITLFKTGDFTKPDPDIFNGDYILRAKQIRKYADEIGMPIVQSHAPFPVHIEGNDEYNRYIMGILIKCIEVCGILGVKNLIIHPWNNWNYKENAIFFKKLLPYAKKHNVVICTENMWNWNHDENHAINAACSSPNDFLKHIEEVNDNYLQACVDVGHANMMGKADKDTTPSNMIRTLDNHIKCFHIHDNDGIHDSHETPFTMNLDWDSLAKAIKDINYRGDLIIEICEIKGATFEQMLERNRLQVEAGRRLIKLIEEK